MERSDGLGEECMLLDERSCSARITCGILWQHGRVVRCTHKRNHSILPLLDDLLTDLFSLDLSQKTLPLLLPFLSDSHPLTLFIGTTKGDLPGVRCADSSMMPHLTCLYIVKHSDFKHKVSHGCHPARAKKCFSRNS